MSSIFFNEHRNADEQHSESDEQAGYHLTFDDPLKCDFTSYKLHSQKLPASKALGKLLEYISSDPALFEMPESNLFINRYWIETWLRSLDADFPIIVQTATFEAHDNPWHGRICALAFFGWDQKQAWLHRTGSEQLDQIWVEYNRYFYHPRIHDQVIPALVQMLFSHHLAEAVHLSIYEVNRDNTRHLKRFGSFCWIDITHQESGWIVPLGQVAPEIHYANSLRRALNSTEKYAKQNKWELSLCDENEYWECLNNASPFHIDKWQNTETPSGFTNAHFKKFHQNFLEEHPSHALLFRIRSKGEDMAIIYLLRAEGKLGFYLGCYTPNLPNKIKIGLWAHAAIINWASEHGFNEYDFMAGDARYKSEFSPHKRHFIAVSLHKKTVKNAMYLLAVSALQKYRKFKTKLWGNKV